MQINIEDAPSVYVRRLKSALRGTGAVTVTATGDEQTLTFEGKDRDGTVRVTGEIAASSGEVTRQISKAAQKPKAKKAAKPKAEAAPKAEPTEPTGDPVDEELAEIEADSDQD
jgi:hypothetical protein